MHTRHLALSVLALAPYTLLGAQATPPIRTDVPVRTVMLFSSGVGYFEHAGTVRGDGATELRFKADQINDVLKSLMLQDQDGGHVTTITYPSQDPLDKTLKSFQVDITGNPTLATLLTQLRGARVTVQALADKLTGTILGVEYRRKPVDKGEPIEEPVLNLLAGATIRAVDLQSLTSLTLDDAQLQDELTKALAALSQSRDQDKKPVTINFAGSGERRVRIGYVVETPIWKTSYRLLLDDKGARLQGWAIVENQTESDWNNVSLSLVSGRPISFVMDLYQPMYATRPTVVPELYAGLHPHMYEGGIAGGGDQFRMESSSLNGPADKALDAFGGAMARSNIVANAGIRPANSPAPAAPFGAVGRADKDKKESEAIVMAARLGELFQYAVGNVTLARQKSAMLPIISDSVSVDRVSIYNASVLTTNPLNGVRLKNTTGKHLLQGPLTVLDKGSYAGDSQINDVPPGQDRLLSYGIDLEMLVDNTKNTQTNDIVTAKITKGTLLIDRRLVSSQDYLADNKSDRDKVLVIEHPIRDGWKLVDTQKPIEATPTLYRFQGKAPAKRITTLSVKEEMVTWSSIGLLPQDITQLITFSRTGEFPAAVRDALVHAVQLKQAVIDTERQIADRTQQINAITQEQNRMRENMKTVAQSTQYYERLLAKLNEQESTIEKLQQERDDLTKKRDVQRKQLEDYLATLTIG